MNENTSALPSQKSSTDNMEMLHTLRHGTLKKKNVMKIQQLSVIRLIIVKLYSFQEGNPSQKSPISGQPVALCHC